MKVGIVKGSLLSLLFSLAKLLAVFESRICNLFLKITLVAVFIYVGFTNSVLIVKKAESIKWAVNYVIWFRNLSPDYFDKLDQESRLVMQRYYDSLKTKPPEKIADMPFPVVSAKSHIVLDVASNTVLSAYQEKTAMPPASTAKLATALASLKYYKLDDEITVPQFCTQVDGVKAEFPQGSRFKVSDLLKALLVYSAGDAACTLSIGESSYADFIGLMNEVAKEHNLVNTKFTNPIGLDDADGENVSTAEDLAKLGVAAIHNNFLKEVVKMNEINLTSIDGGYEKKLPSTNLLLQEIPESMGIKTGNTVGAGGVLVYEYTKGFTDIIIVVMGSKDRFYDTKLVLDWALKSYSWDSVGKM